MTEPLRVVAPCGCVYEVTPTSARPIVTGNGYHLLGRTWADRFRRNLPRAYTLLATGYAIAATERKGMR